MSEKQTGPQIPPIAAEQGMTSPAVGESDIVREPGLSREQLSQLTDYVTKSTDRGLNPEHYKIALGRMEAASIQSGADVDRGRIAITAATVGAMTRSPDKFNLSAKGLIDRLGFSNEDAGHFFGSQRANLNKPAPNDVGSRLRHDLALLQAKGDREGRDVTSQRIAFMAGAFAATTHPGLRRAVFEDLKTQ